VYKSVLKIGDPVLALSLPHGGHLSHGHKASLTSQCYDFHHYHVDERTNEIDYAEVYRMASEFKPKMIVTGASAYTQNIDYLRFSKIAKKVDAYFFVDLAHFGGLVAAGVNPSPVPYADFVTVTCYKTMQGPRGGIILCRSEFAKKIDSAVFPGCQGTSSVSMIAAKAVCLKLAGEEPFRHRMSMVVANARVMCKAFKDRGYVVLGNGTETHQVILDVSTKGLDGSTAEKVLESVGIMSNKNLIPKDSASGAKTVSGLRLGTAGITTRGFKEAETVELVEVIHRMLQNADDPAVIQASRNFIQKMCMQYPLYKMYK